MSLFKALLKNSDLGALAQFVSPAFFSVIPARESLGLISGMIRASRDTEAWTEAQSEIRPHLISLGIEIREFTKSDLVGLENSFAERVLGAYFRQVMDLPVWLLDFRADHWSPSGATLVWSPAKYFYRPSIEFRTAVGALYRGFYGDHVADFDASLRALGMTAANQQIRAHFGSSQQRAVRFSLAEFQKSFAEIFEACKTGGGRIHPEFALLGAMLLSLYGALEAVGAELDVRQTFEKSIRYT